MTYTVEQIADLQIADLALRAGRDRRRVANVRALLDGRALIPADEIAAALDRRPTPEDTEDAHTE